MRGIAKPPRVVLFISRTPAIMGLLLSRRVARALLSLCGLAAGWVSTLPAQSLPPYSPMNPLAYSRSGLETMPYRDPAAGWRLSIITDYANLIELADIPAGRLLIDAELLRTELTVSRDVGTRTFLFGGLGLNGAYDGFLDGFLNWYHDFTGLQVAGREQRPKNQYLYDLELAGGLHVTPPNPGEWLGDIRLGAGYRFTRHWQMAAWTTIPTGDGPAGFRRGVLTANAIATIRAHFARRFTYEGSLGFGWSARHGALENLERTTFAQVSSGVRARIVGPLHLYSNIVYHSPYYRNAGIQAVDRRELTIDSGGIFKFRRGPEWIVGLTEDLEPSGPAIDVAFRIGARW